MRYHRLGDQEAVRGVAPGSRDSTGGDQNADPNWLPLLNTPDHPDYVSGHCTTSGASAETLRLVLGNDGVPFTATVAGGMSRSYQNLTQAEKEIGDARVWAGIHTRTADEHGGIVGRKIADLVVQRALKPQAAAK